jgi:hypothetical protein
MVALHGQVHHVQGLDVDNTFIYVTSVDVRRHRGFLHKFTCAGKLVAVLDLTNGPGTTRADCAARQLKMQPPAGAKPRRLKADKSYRTRRRR